jgi:hypothetical protein
MPELTITKTEKIPYGYRFLRSDGREFFMLANTDESASLFAGAFDRPPHEEVSGLDRNITDKVEAAKRLILAYTR